VLGLNAQQAKQQAQTDPNLMAPRALIKNPAQAQKVIKLEFADVETFSQEHFIVNGLLDQGLLDSTILADLETAKDAGEAQVEFYLVTGEDNLLIGTATLDENNNFSFINGSNLEAGTHNIVASYTDEKTKQKHFSAVTELTIDPTAPELDLNLESFAGLSASILESTSLGSQASRQLAYAESSNGVKVLSGVELDPGQAINLSLDVDSNLARVVVNFQSVLYSATAITSSTNSEIDVQAPLELSFKPGSQHVATAYAESLEDPDLKSKPVIIEFSIKQTTPWYLQTYSLITGLLLVVALGFGIFRRKKV
jgi:hypothetical protein